MVETFLYEEIFLYRENKVVFFKLDSKLNILLITIYVIGKTGFMQLRCK